MKKEHVVATTLIVLVAGVLVFSWVWYQNSKQSTAAASGASTTTKTS